MDTYIMRDNETIKVEFLEWAQWFEANKGTRHVGDTMVGDVRVSTVFIGLDHRFGDGPPLLFETMIFGGEHDQWQDRYTTYAQAERGHARVVAALQSGQSPEAA